MTRYLKTLVGTTLLVCVQLTSCSQGAILASGPIQPLPQHSFIARTISNAAAVYHYEKPKINDELSSVTFNMFLEDMDNNRSFFLDADIKKFEAFRHSLDDAMKTGELEVPYEIFNTFTERFNETIDFVLAHLADSIDYNTKETFIIDREEEPWFKSPEEREKYWKERIRYDLINLRLSNSDIEKNIETLTKRYTNMKSQWSKMNSEDVFQIFVNSFSAAIDPHTQYFSPKDAEDFRINMSKNLEGIGATLQTDGDYTVVRQVVKGSPADKSNEINPGDRIVGVGQGKEGEFEDVVGWRIDEVVDRIRGPKGTVVRLKIVPAAADLSTPPKIVSIVRDKINLEDQRAKSEIKEVEHNGNTFRIGVISVLDFYIDFDALRAGDPDYNSATRDVRKALEEFKAQGGVDGVVIDLRNNGGGSLKEAIELTGLFIKEGPVVQVKDTRSRIEVNRDEDPAQIYSGPLAVLINRFSASASEIFAGAIQDYQRGLIIGEQSFGKGTVQTQVSINDLFPGSDEKMGQYNITIAKFYRVSGGSTQNKGVIPDILFPSAFPAEEFGESAQPTALPWDQIEPADYQLAGNLSTLTPDLEKLHEARMETSKDYEYLLQDIKEFKKKLEDQTVLLNFEHLQKEREEDKSEQLARTNAYRSSKGLPVLSEEQAEKADTVGADLKPDLIMKEGLQVLTDLIDLRGARAVVKENEILQPADVH
ncbi:carboxyl-terminal processing protease [Anseongella ginsenosidimutans]|uniref:Carboxyl-terminal processing protease n=1 Tax=Anseongella ginsenosidimutans TaxID=496056 RepID=A0A4R3KUY7_9SPHI|nr:carboxy terminal-processing peptidase [Anseongella ginsenosidimutans]QEC51556.1 tail-specific protease [Anseongella ginsenosidimutans]TCS88881.1 carboxyl-terminal processing protease [Anseongella ginsenosidimutans]